MLKQYGSLTCAKLAPCTKTTQFFSKWNVNTHIFISTCYFKVNQCRKAFKCLCTWRHRQHFALSVPHTVHQGYVQVSRPSSDQLKPAGLLWKKPFPFLPHCHHETHDKQKSTALPLWHTPSCCCSCCYSSHQLAAMKPPWGAPWWAVTLQPCSTFSL